MRAKIFKNANIQALLNAYEAVGARTLNTPGIALVHGTVGYGKTSGACWLAVRTNAIFLTALPIWTPASMVGKLCEEAGVRAVRGAARNFDLLAREFTVRPRAIFIDEIEPVLDMRALVETLRILHDITAVPLFLIGMAEARRKIESRPQLQRRVTAEVEFKPLTLDDARAMAVELCEVDIAIELVDTVHRHVKGSVGQLCAELARLETFGRRRGLGRVSYADLTDRERAPLAAAMRAAA